MSESVAILRKARACEPLHHLRTGRARARATTRPRARSPASLDSRGGRYAEEVALARGTRWNDRRALERGSKLLGKFIDQTRARAVRDGKAHGADKPIRYWFSKSRGAAPAALEA